MDARKYLEDYEDLNLKIKNKEREVERWKLIAEGSTGSSDGERVQSSGTKQKMENAVVTYSDLEKEIDSLKRRRASIMANIDKLKGKQYDLVYKHYVLGMNIKSIAMSHGMSESWGTTTHSRALQSMQKILDEEKVWQD